MNDKLVHNSGLAEVMAHKIDEYYTFSDEISASGRPDLAEVIREEAVSASVSAGLSYLDGLKANLLGLDSIEDPHPEKSLIQDYLLNPQYPEFEGVSVNKRDFIDFAVETEYGANSGDSMQIAGKAWARLTRMGGLAINPLIRECLQPKPEQFIGSNIVELDLSRIAIAMQIIDDFIENGKGSTESDVSIPYFGPRIAQCVRNFLIYKSAQIKGQIPA